MPSGSRRAWRRVGFEATPLRAVPVATWETLAGA